MVDLTLAYLNTHDQVKEVQAKLETLGSVNDEQSLPATEASRRRPKLSASSTPVRDRLPPENLSALLESFQSGVPKTTLASQYGISVSSIKRLRRKHGARRKPTHR